MKPLVADYRASMARSLASAGMTVPLQVMQSRGGLISSAIARQRPARLFLSGATAGVVGGIEADVRPASASRERRVFDTRQNAGHYDDNHRRQRIELRRWASAHRRENHHQDVDAPVPM